MARIELPVRSYIETFMRRAFPERDFSRGSGINDLVIKAFAVLMQPMRHEIDVVKANQSLLNYLYMKPADLDALAANWGKFRQTGSRVEGVVRLYFNEAADYSLSFLQFTDDAGSSYQLAAPVTITIADLTTNSRSDGTFFFDVRVRSTGIGERYVVPAGSIRTVSGGPSSLFSVENIDDFQVTSPNESNFDVVNAMYRNIGLRNLVSRASIRAPLIDQFSNLLDLLIAGSDHAKSFRDLVTVDIDGQPVELHLGGTVDVWCNTNSLSQREVTISYLPSSQRIRIVSSDQASAGELAYAFSRGLLTAEGMFVSPDDVAKVIDESFSVIFDQDGLSVTSLVTADAVNSRWPLAAKDLTGGSDLVFMPSRGQSNGTHSIYAVDPVGPNIGRTSIAVGDMISTGLHGRRRITAKSGRVIELSPVEEQITILVPSAAVNAGEREIPATGAHLTTRINDHIRINGGAAAGQYTVLGKATDTLYIGKPVAQGIMEELENLGAGRFRWQMRGEQLAAPITLFVHAIDQVLVNVTVTEIYFPTGFSLAAVHLGDMLTLAGVNIGVDGTYPVIAVNTLGSRHFVTISTALVNVASPAPGTATMVRPATFKSATLPNGVDGTYWVYVGTGGAHDQTSALWARIESIVRLAATVELTVVGPALGGATTGLIVGGLSGPLVLANRLAVERDAVSHVASATKLDDTMNGSFYVSSLTADMAAGTVDMSAIGIGEQVGPGDLVTFIGLSGVAPADLPRTGGDGTKVTAFVAAVLTPDRITLVAPFPFTVPIDTTFTVSRNASKANIATLAAVNTGSKTVQLTSVPRGIGDATGMALAKDLPQLTGLLIAAIGAYTGHARIVFTGSPLLSTLFLSDKLVIADVGTTAVYDGTYRIISIDPTTSSMVIAATFGADWTGPDLDASVTRRHVNQIAASTAGSVRALQFVPPKKVYKVTMSSEVYSPCLVSDVGRTVEQPFGNITYRGTLNAFDNVARTWEIEPAAFGVDVFTTAIPQVYSSILGAFVIPGFKSCATLGGGISSITFSAGVILDNIRIGDNIAVTGGTLIDGTYAITEVFPSATVPYVKVAGTLATIPGPGAYGSCSITRPGFQSCVPVGGSSLIYFPQGVDIRNLVPGDRMVISGGTVIDGAHFITAVNATTLVPYVTVAGDLTSIPGPGPYGTVTVTRPTYVAMVGGGGAKGYPTIIDTNTGAGYVRGYVAPTVPADLGKIVRQGTYSGMLDSVATGVGVYTWFVRPISEADLFDRTDATTYLVNSTSSPVPTDPQGTLSVKASDPTLDLGSVTFVLTGTPLFSAMDVVDVLPRFTRNCALVNGSTIRANERATSGIMDFVAAGIVAGDQLMVLHGDNIGTYSVTEITQYSLTIDAELSEELVRIANAPSPQPLPIPSGGLNLTAGDPIVVPGSLIGVWGGTGRVLRITGGGTTYLIPLDASPSNDSVLPVHGTPVTLSAATSWTWEVVEGFNLNFWVVSANASDGFRIYHPPVEIGTTLWGSLTGTTSAGSSSLRDNSANFQSLIGGMDLGAEILVYIDSGSAANVVPYQVSQVVGPNQIILTGITFNVAESSVQYRIVYRPAVTAKEGWFRGTVLDSVHIRLDVLAGTDLLRNSTTFNAIVLVEPLSFGAPVAPWTCTRLTGSYNPSTGILTLDANTGESESQPTDIWDDAGGFKSAVWFDTVRVHLRCIDRIIVPQANGSVLNTYNYYANAQFFTLPVVRVKTVELLDIQTLSTVRQLPYTFEVGDKGLRYGADEMNAIFVDDPDAKFQPIRITYTADAGIRGINDYLNNPDTRVLGQNAMAKRMETIAVDLSLRVLSEKVVSAIAVAAASYINSLRSSQRLTKVEIIKYLFDQQLISYVDLDTSVMNVTYYSADGVVTSSPNVFEYFGSDIACYLSGNINITKILRGA